MYIHIYIYIYTILRRGRSPPAQRPSPSRPGDAQIMPLRRPERLAGYGWKPITEIIYI